MKKIWIILFWLPLAVFAEKLTVETIFRPAVATAGEPVEITVITNISIDHTDLDAASRDAGVEQVRDAKLAEIPRLRSIVGRDV